MATLHVRNLALGMGAPKLCTPILGRTAREVISQAKALRTLPVDMAEWRFDAAKETLWRAGGPGEKPDLRRLFCLLGELRIHLRDMPLLFTYRTEAELAGREDCQEDYMPVLRAAMESGQADIIDIELGRGEETAAALAAENKAAGGRSLLSLHDYQKTPSEENMLRTLLRMEDAGADIAKLAVTPQCPADVLAIFSATETARTRLSIPVATMGMGRLGMLTRLGGGVFGSAFTFGAASQESAPGQPPAEALRAVLELLHAN
ncbi:MAG: type I 3-dehydroquinate dehydratase [Candidatus Pelethousia sp.]|nr:type I 3-dehydroquinate dehydratase [Candidatus Pelethousia sp.]